ncbi:MAG: Uma2 family endonuclease [Egibacteraceae bacterium]
MSAQTACDVERWRFTVEKYERMGQTGIFGEDDRLELIEGEIVRMSPIGPVHAWFVDLLNRVLVLQLRDRAIVRVQNPLRLAPHSEPQPDLAIVRRRRSYLLGHPTAADVLLVIEVADTSLAFDRKVKIRMYALAGIYEVWVIDIASRAIIVFSGPLRDTYLSERTVRPGEKLTVPGFDDVVLTVADLFEE